MKKSTRKFLIFFVFITAILVAGCISSRGDPAQAATSISNLTPTTPNQTSISVTTSSISITPTVSTSPPSASTVIAPGKTTAIIPIYGGDSSDQPSTDNLIFTLNYFPFTINNCEMQDIFPNVAKDSAYGIRQTPPKLIGLSPNEINQFRWEYTEGGTVSPKVIDIPQCEGRPPNPQWNFVEVRTTISSRDQHPTTYTVGINVRSAAKIAAQFTFDETLVRDQPVTMVTYIPLKTDEMQYFDGVSVVFRKNSPSHSVTVL